MRRLACPVLDPRCVAAVVKRHLRRRPQPREARACDVLPLVRNGGRSKMTDVRHGTERLLRALLKQAIEAAEADERPLGTRVHEMRAALKKARALLNLVRSLLGRRARE